MTTQKIKSGRMPGVDADSFIAPLGTLFFNEDQGDLRLGDGVTAGGIPLAVGGGGGGGYVLPTASTTVKGGVKVDGTTINIANQIISVVNGVFTSGSYADPSWITSLAYSKLTGTPTIPSNTNQLTNGSGFITSSALTGYATETFVTTRGYLTSVSWNDVQSKPTFATVATSGSYTDLINKPTIPTDISQLTDSQGLLNQNNGGSGTTYVENPYTFSVAGDDSTLREILNGETLRFAGATGITITTDAEGKVTITGPDLSLYATQSYITSQGYITSSALTGYATETFVTTRGYLTSVSWNDVQSKPTFATVATSGSYNDLSDKPSIPTNTNQLTNGAGFITSSALSGYATETFVTTQGYLTTVDWSIITSKPSFATVATSGSYTDLINKPTLFSGSYNDLTNKPTLFSGSYNDLTDKPSIPTNTNELTNGAGFITSSALVGYATESYVTGQGYITNSSLGNFTFTVNTIDTSDSSAIQFTPAVVFNSDVTVENDLIVVNQLRTLGGDLFATESFVQQAVNDLIGAAPAALDTLKELADALGNDNNFATTILNALNNRVRFDTAAQGLTELQKSNARTNIGAASTQQLNLAVTDLQAEMYAAALAMG